MSVNITGLAQLQRKLRTMSERARALHGNHSVKLDELFPPAFLRRNTPFSSVDDMFAQSGFQIESAEDFKAVPNARWDAFIAGRTKFRNWKSMQESAAAEWTKKKMGL